MLPVDASLVAAFLAMSVVLSLVPGPSIVFASGRALAHGRAAGLWTVVGDLLGGWVLVALVAFGLGSLVSQSAIVFTIVKVVGAGYLIVLGIRALLALRRTGRIGAPDAEPLRGGALARIRDGVLIGATNPKSIVFLGAVLPQFVDPSRSSVVVQMLLLGLIGSILQLAINATWVLAASALRAWFDRRPRRRRVVEAAGGITMIGFGAQLAVAQRP